MKVSSHLLLLAHRKKAVCIHDTSHDVVLISVLGAFVLAALTTPISHELSSVQRGESSSLLTSETSSPTTPVSPDKSASKTPHHALDMLLSVLRNADKSVKFPVEVRANVCSLLFQLGRNSSGEELVRLKDTFRPVLESLAGNVEPLLERGIQRVLDSWS